MIPDLTAINPNTSQSVVEPRSSDHSQPGPSGLQRKLLSAYDISPVPLSKKKSTNRAKKPSKAAVITSSPYKEELLLSTANKNKPNVKAVKGKISSQSNEKMLSKKSQKNKRQQPIDESEDETQFTSADENLNIDDMLEQKKLDVSDGDCLFCNREFSEDRKGELWIQCLICNLWYHVDCTGADKNNYVCDFYRTD